MWINVKHKSNRHDSNTLYSFVLLLVVRKYSFMRNTCVKILQVWISLSYERNLFPVSTFANTGTRTSHH